MYSYFRGLKGSVPIPTAFILCIQISQEVEGSKMVFLTSVSKVPISRSIPVWGPMTHAHSQKLQTEVKDKTARWTYEPVSQHQEQWVTTNCGRNSTSSLNVSRSRNSNGGLHVEHCSVDTHISC